MHPTAKWLALSLLVLAGCGGPSGDGPAPSPGDGPDPKPTVQLKILDFDQTMALIKSHQGKIVVVDLWATS